MNKRGTAVHNRWRDACNFNLTVDQLINSHCSNIAHKVNSENANVYKC